MMYEQLEAGWRDGVFDAHDDRYYRQTWRGSDTGDLAPRAVTQPPGAGVEESRLRGAVAAL
jgi:hypothetical protein